MDFVGLKWDEVGSVLVDVAIQIYKTKIRENAIVEFPDSSFP